jgi:hypothetical protein
VCLLVGRLIRKTGLGQAAGLLASLGLLGDRVAEVQRDDDDDDDDRYPCACTLVVAMQHLTAGLVPAMRRRRWNDGSLLRQTL